MKSTCRSIPARLAPLLTQKAQQLEQANRRSAKKYNHGRAEFVKVSVRWPVDFYNRMQFLSYHKRMSVSLLMHAFLLLWHSLPELFRKSKGNFRGNSYLTVTRKPNNGMVSFKEVITFFTGSNFDYG